MPGVVVSTGVRAGASGTTTNPASTLFMAGEAERGPTSSAVLCTSMTDFVKFFGDFSSSGVLWQHAQTYFEEGGTRAYFTRYVGPTSPSSGTLAITGRTAGQAVVVNAANNGAWSSDVSLNFVDGVVATNVRLTVTLKGVTQWVSSDLTTNTEIVSAINGNVPHLITATLGTGGNGAGLPAAGSGAGTTVTLSSGSNGGTTTNTEAVAALANFGSELGVGAVALPGRTGSTVWDALRSHAVNNRRIALCAFGSTDTNTAAQTAIAALSQTTDGLKQQYSHMAFYWPYVSVPDGSGGSRNISPESYVAAARADAINSAGPWRPPAGTISTARFVTGLASTVTKATGDLLDTYRINALRIIDGGVRVYGARSASADELNWRYITYRDTLNSIASSAETTLEQYTFSVIDARKTVFGQINSALVSILEDIRAKGGLYELADSRGVPIDRGYSIEVSDAINPIADLANGIIKARIGVRVNAMSDQIQVTITKSTLSAGV